MQCSWISLVIYLGTTRLLIKSIPMEWTECSILWYLLLIVMPILPFHQNQVWNRPETFKRFASLGSRDGFGSLVGNGRTAAEADTVLFRCPLTQQQFQFYKVYSLYFPRYLSPILNITRIDYQEISLYATLDELDNVFQNLSRHLRVKTFDVQQVVNRNSPHLPFLNWKGLKVGQLSVALG